MLSVQTLTLFLYHTEFHFIYFPKNPIKAIVVHSKCLAPYIRLVIDIHQCCITNSCIILQSHILSNPHTIKTLPLRDGSTVSNLPIRLLEIIPITGMVEIGLCRHPLLDLDKSVKLAPAVLATGVTLGKTQA